MKWIGPGIFLVVIGGVVAYLFSIQAEVESSGGGPAHGSAAFEQALTQARENGKPIMVMFTASWCGPCQHMKNKVFPSPAVSAERAKWNWVLLDADSKSNQKLMREYNVRGLPTFVLLSPTGKRLTSFSGGRSPQDFAAMLRRHSGS